MATRTEPSDLHREELQSRFNPVMELASSEAPRSVVEVAAAALLLESGLLSREQSFLHFLLADVPEGYVEHAEEALRHANLAMSTMSRDDSQPLIISLEMSLEIARRCKAIVDRAVKEKVVDTGVMMDLLANEGELQLFLKRYIAAMDAAHGPPRTAPKDVVSLSRAPAYDLETSLLLGGLMARLRFANKSAEATPEEPALEETLPKAKETGGNVPDAKIEPESV